MAYVTYDCGIAGYATLQNPTITIAHATEVSAYQQFTVLVRMTYTIRGLVTAADSASLKIVLEHYRTILNISGGIFTVNYGNDADFLTTNPAVDVTGGPHPVYLNIQEMHGGKSAIVTWSLQTDKHVADDNINAVGAWLDFTYTVNTTLNANFYATRTISGILRLSACHTQTMYRTADAFRETVETNIAPVPATGIWQRIARNYRLSEDHKVLAFTIVDEQLYTALPYGITSGDIALTTIAEKYGTGRFILNGWFESNPLIARGAVQQTIKTIWELFYNLVVKRIESETAGDEAWWIVNERRSYTAHWRSNRIEFEAAYEIFGEFEPGIPDNIEYTVNRALDWLAYLSRNYNRAIVDFGPNGSAPVIGRTGIESPGPIILIDPMEKLPAGFAYGPGTPGTSYPGSRDNAVSGVAKQNSYITYHQSFEYKYDSGKVFIPVLDEDVCDIVQQVKNISIYLVITGEAERIGEEPMIPLFEPYRELPAAEAGDRLHEGPEPYSILVSADFVTHEPSAIGLYKTTWKQVYKLYNPGESLTMKWPTTPLNEELGGKELYAGGVPALPWPAQT